MANHELKAMLRFWRQHRGLSQLDLALAAGISARHLSFLETGRSRPTLEMLKRVLAPLALQLRDYCDVMQAGGFENEIKPQTALTLSDNVEMAMKRMMEKHEPYPLVVLSGDYKILRLNRGASNLFVSFLFDENKLTADTTMFDLVFDPLLTRPFIQNWQELARHMLVRLNRECIAKPANRNLAQLKARVLQYPNIDKSWLLPNFDYLVEATFTVHLERAGITAKFITTITTFSTPTTAAMEELKLESYFPVDSNTAELCERISKQDPTKI
jgi:transcriptional regulator with XRE-family HTH domain